MNSIFRDFLLASGVKPSDISDAVRESRKVVRGVERWSSLAQRAALHVAAKAKAESVVQKGAFLAAGAATFANQKASVMLGKGKK